MWSLYRFFHKKQYLCPVCGKHHFMERGAYEICPVCGWEDDPVQRREPDFEGGANELSLNRYKARYEEGLHEQE
ncbi:MAG: hypothetical protein II035_03700 [Firmicutes bacterium]|jgi:RNA polymerase subunit RPABC4/transcription elongation factor Spt4|nr:hypothetical protein [Bacillota bacterium]MEE3383354.1 CPCC family cysteine-rich protein [Anaerovoracaceae bacterium]MBQ1430652.1 hypothetical protein [Bacillota bacterium]MBQ1630568.1 hypothetical protein [Bacillota bacterium]MBQ1691089.1 hypothetical protein [Bacillota bacterium]